MIMPNLNWSKLNRQQLGKYAEYYAKMEFSSHGLDVYTSEVDNHGVDFIAKTKSGKYLEVQVKSVCRTKYVFMQKDKWNIEDENIYLVLLLFEDGKFPDAFLIPSIEWKTPNQLLCDKNYNGLKSKPEYGLNLSQKNQHLLQKYSLDSILFKLI